MGFAALADLKNQLNIPSSDTTNDTELTIYLNASNEVCEALVGPSASTSFSELYGADDGLLILMHRPVIAITSVTPTSGAVLASTAYTLDKDRNAVQINAGLPGQWTVVYTAGWTSIPARAQLAQVIIGQHLWETQRGGMVPSAFAPQEMVTLPGMGFAIPRRAAELLASLGSPATVPGIA